MLAAEGLTFCYAGALEPALRGASLSVGPGEVVLLCGPSGCGKTTLLRLLKPAIAPAGSVEGSVTLDGRPLADVPAREQAAAVGFVGQHATEQMVCADVRHELAFGLESLGAPAPLIRARVAEVATYLGIADLVGCPTGALSAGQQQLVSLAAAMVAGPRVLVLDEPCAHLDPLSARRLMEAVVLVNRERGVAVLMADHRLAEALPRAHRVAVMGKGRIAFEGSPDQAARFMLREGSPLAEGLPASALIAAGLDADAPGPLPLDVAAGQRWLRAWAAAHPLPDAGGAGQAAQPGQAGEGIALGGAPDVPACSVRRAWLRYGPDGADVLRDASLDVPAGGIHGLLGANGSGKSTLLKAMAGVLRPYRGRIEHEGRPLARRKRPSVALLPQHPLDLLPHDAVRACLAQAQGADGANGAAAAERALALAAELGVGGTLDAHPRDLSAGEQQRVALALVLAQEPRLLLLDEPTRSLDPQAAGALARILHGLADHGITVLMATHDLRFCAEHADTVALLFDGSVAACAPVRQAFAEWSLLAPDAVIVARGIVPDAITAEEVTARWRA